MNTARDIYIEATRRGLRLEPAGDKLAVIPKGKCPSDFADILREHKRELLDWLETRTIQLTPDQVPWLHVARQILAGEFVGADGSTIASLKIGLCSIPHLKCAQAMAQLCLNE
jgi:hypothetical protein